MIAAVLFFDLAMLAPATPDFTADDLAVYQRALADFTRPDHLVNEGTSSRACDLRSRSTDELIEAVMVLGYRARNRTWPKLSKLVPSAQLVGPLMNRAPEVVALSAVGWNDDRTEAFLQLDGESGIHCLFYRRVGKKLRLVRDFGGGK